MSELIGHDFGDRDLDVDQTWYILGVLDDHAGGMTLEISLGPQTLGMARYPKISTNLMDLKMGHPEASK